MVNKLKTFCQCYREKRVIGAVKEIIRFKIYLPSWKLQGLLMDKYYEIDTEEIVELLSLGINSDVGNGHESTPFSHISKIMRTLEITPKDVFLDMGSGKGRTLLMAGMYPFKSVIGVDVSDWLNSVCNLNIEKMKSKLKAKNILTITSNAADYEIPDDTTFIYFFNPFGMEVMKKVVERIIDSVGRFQRKVTIIWYNPKYEIELERIYNLKKAREMNWKNFGLYRSRVVFYEINR
jgi:hypothetical protein